MGNVKQKKETEKLLKLKNQRNIDVKTMAATQTAVQSRNCHALCNRTFRSFAEKTFVMQSMILE